MLSPRSRPGAGRAVFMMTRLAKVSGVSFTTLRPVSRVVHSHWSLVFKLVEL